ncbi:hypothetical protein CDL15_Pgr026368 [Punica granatum]|uniref:Uncharacterized protein n=1 Tax=Punica granatum TaxID=22663 RepID=A0A218XPB1_PUNGR|nr:hypothetical protein CDL15_Pgr026368 [Punica granatum]PKI36478.1 hypothetical protein CRG98_043116 [Punica granatum]
METGGKYSILSGAEAEAAAAAAAGRGGAGGLTSSWSYSQWNARNGRLEPQLVGLGKKAGTAASSGGPGAVAGRGGEGRNSNWSAVAVERGGAAGRNGARAPGSSKDRRVG